MQKDLFITGTDTEIGKTYSTLCIMESIKAAGKSVAGMKPVASGAELTRCGLRNDDALALQKHASAPHEYASINPYVFKPPIAPQFAAQATGIRIDIDKIHAHYLCLKERADVVVVEGIGGWCVPLDNTLLLADLVKKLDLNIVLVVGLRLGCINHALLTVKTIMIDGMHLSGWVANQIDPDYNQVSATIECLQARISVPMLGYLPYQKVTDINAISEKLDISAII